MLITGNVPCSHLPATAAEYCETVADSMNLNLSRPCDSERLCWVQRCTEASHCGQRVDDGNYGTKECK